jgi:phosphoadenosine phosphosulfate reductase
MQQLNMITGQTKEEEAIEFIQENEPKDEPYFFGFSGGKDSIVLMDLIRKAGVKKHTFYSLMPDPPELIRFIQKFHVTILRPQFTFWHGVETWFPPHRNSRWCCDYIKEKPSVSIPLTHRLLGIRAEESTNRANRGKINQRTKKRINYHPLFDWKEWEIWDYIEGNGLAYCKLYDEGFSRLGCVVCPMRAGSKEQELYRERYPQYFRLFEKACLRWYDRIGHHRERTRGRSQLFEEFIRNWYAGK